MAFNDGQPRRPWTDDEQAVLADDIAPVIAARIGRTVAAVRRRRRQLDMQVVRASRPCAGCGELLSPEPTRTGAPRKRCPQCVAERTRATSRAYYKRNPAKSSGRTRRWRLLSSYGITPGDYDLMFSAQAGGCAICGTKESDSYKRRFYIDHDHVSGAVRGLLCGACNMGIGQMKDNPALLRAAAEYIESNRLRVVGGRG